MCVCVCVVASRVACTRDRVCVALLASNSFFFKFFWGFRVLKMKQLCEEEKKTLEFFFFYKRMRLGDLESLLSRARDIYNDPR